MGSIHEDVRAGHLKDNPGELPWVRIFQNGFDITWARRGTYYGSNLSLYFLKPEKSTEETFGIDREILMIYSRYDSLEARLFQAIEQVINEYPARGRVDRLFTVLVSEMPNPENWINEYTSTNEARTVVAINRNDLASSYNNPWFVRNKLSSQLFSRDLFDYRLPLERDIYFFGRAALLNSFRDSTRRSENRGLFGLRKTGKTSFLYKLQRELKEQENAVVLMYDCKSPSIRQRTWDELLRKVIMDLAKSLSSTIEIPEDGRFLSETLSSLVKLTPAQRRVTIIFDEVEYISYFSKTDVHWRNDYLPFWQSIWATQSETRKLSAVLAGVNPKLVEIDKIDGNQNPLFGIVSYDYLNGLSVDEIRRMLNVLGRRMGLKFEPDVADFFEKEYGGHPLLCRLAASFTYKKVIQSGHELPINVNLSALEKASPERNRNLVFYCGHVVSELLDFYPEEYQVFELLACGQVADYLEFSAIPEFSSHLTSYGLVEDVEGVPTVAIEVVGTYVALEAARREGRKTIQKLVDVKNRESWITEMVKNIDSAFEDIHRIEKTFGSVSLFGPNKYPESHNFMSLKPVRNKNDLQIFLNICNRCFVESIEVVGRSLNDPGYFWGRVKQAYPQLHQALHRIKIYRHNEFHMELNDTVDQVYRSFLRQDLENRDPKNVTDLWFTLQQATIESLWNALQIELSRYGR